MLLIIQGLNRILAKKNPFLNQQFDVFIESLSVFD